MYIGLKVVPLYLLSDKALTAAPDMAAHAPCSNAAVELRPHIP